MSLSDITRVSPEDLVCIRTHGSIRACYKQIRIKTLCKEGEMWMIPLSWPLWLRPWSLRLAYWEQFSRLLFSLCCCLFVPNGVAGKLNFHNSNISEFECYVVCQLTRGIRLDTVFHLIVLILILLTFANFDSLTLMFNRPSAKYRNYRKTFIYDWQL